LTKLPHLASFAKNKDISVYDIVHTEFLEDMFDLPMSAEAYLEFQELEVMCLEAQVIMQSGSKDIWTYIWGNANFTVKKAYMALIGVQPAPVQFNWIWESSCQARQKFFFWLLLHDRLNTRNLLGRKQMLLPCYNYATLNYNMQETLMHLFWECPFAQRCWDFVYPSRTNGLPLLEAISDIKDKLKVPFYMEIIILSSWAIWIVRNERIFENKSPTFNTWKAIFHQELKLLKYRIKKKFESEFLSWLEYFL
jgi:hypothetical protein